MHTWQYHYRESEALLSKSYQPDKSGTEVASLIARAQVHATLASLKFTEESPCESNGTSVGSTP